MNAVARTFVDPVSAWPATLPWPQLPSVQINWDQPTDNVGTLAGPTRLRLAHPNASPTYEFEIDLTADECENFEAWYDEVVALGGEVYLPWIGEGRILYFTQYELAPLGTGWKLHALATQLYVDPDYVDRHVCDAAYAWRVQVLVDADERYPVIACELPSAFLRPRLIDTFFSAEPIAVLVDPWDSPDTIVADLGATNVWNGNSWQNGQPATNAILEDAVVADLDAPLVFVDVPANWMWEEQLEAWYADHRMIYIDNWWAVWMEGLVNACRLLKDRLPPPWPIVNGNDMLDFAWRERVVADMFPLETYFDVRVDFPLPTLTFTAAPTTVIAGESATLTWATDNAYAVLASGGWSGKRERAGAVATGPLWQTTSFTLSATGPGGGPVTQTVTVVAITPIPPPPPLPTATITATPASVVTGGSSVLTWATTDAATVTASGGWSGSLPTSGSVGRALASTTTFTITASNFSGSARASVTVEATEPPAPPPPLFTSQLRVVARPGGAPGQYGFFLQVPPIGSVTPGSLPTGGSALGLRIQAISSAPGVVGGVDLYLMTDGADSRLTQTNQFDSVTVVDDSGVTRTFTTAPQPALTFGNGGQYGRASWVWSGDNQVMRTAGKTYTFTFTKAT